MVSYIDETIAVFKRDESIITKTLIGIAMICLSFLVIPALLYQGYLMKILEETENGFPEQLPEWKNYTELFKYGLIAFGISLVGIIPGYALILAPVLAGIESAAILALTIGGGFIYLLIFGYLSLALYAIIYRDSESLSTDVLTTMLFSKDYFIGWSIIMIIGIVLSIFSLIVNIFTFGIGSIFMFPFFIPINYVSMLIMGVAITNSQTSEE